MGFALIVFLLERTFLQGSRVHPPLWWCLRSQVCRGVTGVTVFNVYVRLDARVNFLQGQQGAQLLSLLDRTFILNWLNVENFDTET